MHRFVTSVALAASLAAGLTAQQITVPSSLANAEGATNSSIWRNGTNRVQCIYDTSNFVAQGLSQTISIQRVSFRLAGGLASSISTYSNVQVFLQPAAVDYLAPSTTFASNRSAALGSPNFTGTVTTVAVPGTTPNGYFVDIQLSTPFVYSPRAGQDLLLELVIAGGPTPAVGNTVSCSVDTTAQRCNSVATGGSTSAATGTIQAQTPVVFIQGQADEALLGHGLEAAAHRGLVHADHACGFLNRQPLLLREQQEQAPGLDAHAEGPQVMLRGSARELVGDPVDVRRDVALRIDGG